MRKALHLCVGATAWAKVAFINLPPLDQFLAMRLQPAFKARCIFEENADKLHDALLLGRGVDQQDHIREHQLHFAQQLRAKDNRDPSAYELEDVAHMLTQRGVAPVPDSVMKWAHETIGSSSRLGLSAIVDTFRRDRKIRNAGDKVTTKKTFLRTKTVGTKTGRRCRLVSLWKYYGEWISQMKISRRLCKCAGHVCKLALNSA
jgi:hypothetical protein